MAMIMERVMAIHPETQPGMHTCLDISIAELEACLADVDYPAIKRDLLHQAEFHDATPDVMAFLQILPEGKYHQFHDIASLAWAFLIV